MLSYKVLTKGGEKFHDWLKQQSKGRMVRIITDDIDAIGYLLLLEKHQVRVGLPRTTIPKAKANGESLDNEWGWRTVEWEVCAFPRKRIQHIEVQK